MPDQQLSLSEYLETVQEIVKISFGDPVWVKAEIRSLNTKSGHCYLELAEKEEGTDKVIASCKGTIWKSTAAKLLYKFQNESGMELSKDLNVLIKVKASFSPQYGFSVNIEDIDSSFTLGDLARRYQQIVKQLTEDGLIDKNKKLPTPFDINKVLVIAPEQAAGLGDFRKDADILHKAGVCEFIYHSATFQGNTAAASIIASLSQGLRQWANEYKTPPDLIVIIRGGGAVNDLAYLNDYDLAALLCKRSVPIWVGIGHERDKTILDEIAHRSFDTPSKVIGGIRNHIAERVDEVKVFIQSIQLYSQQQIQAYQSQNDQLMQITKSMAQAQLNQTSKQADQVKTNVHYFAQQQLKRATLNVETLMRMTLIQNPTNVLARGYAIVRSGGKAITSIHQAKDQTLAIQLHDGLINTQVLQVKPNE